MTLKWKNINNSYFNRISINWTKKYVIFPKEIPKDFGFIDTSKNGSKQRTFFGLIERPDVILFLAFVRAKSSDKVLWGRVRTAIHRWLMKGFQPLCYWPVIITGFGHNETVVISVNAAVIVANFAEQNNEFMANYYLSESLEDDSNFWPYNETKYWIWEKNLQTIAEQNNFKVEKNNINGRDSLYMWTVSSICQPFNTCVFKPNTALGTTLILQNKVFAIRVINTSSLNHICYYLSLFIIGKPKTITRLTIRRVANQIPKYYIHFSLMEVMATLFIDKCRQQKIGEKFASTEELDEFFNQFWEPILSSMTDKTDLNSKALFYLFLPSMAYLSINRNNPQPINDRYFEVLCRATFVAFQRKVMRDMWSYHFADTATCYQTIKFIDLKNLFTHYFTQQKPNIASNFAEVFRRKCIMFFQNY